VRAESTVELESEARHLHRAFFRNDPPAEVVGRYVAANAAHGEPSGGLVERVVALRLDAEAVELALRLRQGPTALTRKIQILFYLLEVRPEYFGFFVGEAEGQGRAAWGVLLSLLRTAGKYLKGAYLVRRHGLV
jgi:hypothetical protein